MEFNLGIFFAQLINFALVFFLFKKLVGNKLHTAYHTRKMALDKAAGAEEIYAQFIQEGEEKKAALIQEGVVHKEQLVQEAKLKAEQVHEKILQDAEQKAAYLVQEAAAKTGQLERELKEGFVDGVKRTTRLVVNKLIEDKAELEESYVERLVKEFTA